MLSMTGYGRAEYNENNISLVVEMKSVNNRNFDFSAKMPRAFIALEDGIRKAVNKHVARGRVDLFITFSDNREKTSNLSVDIEKATAYFNASKLIAESLGLDNDCTVSMLMKSPDVITDNSILDATELEHAIITTVEQACINFNAMRKVEGEKLVLDMLNRVDTVKELVDKITLRAPLVAIDYKKRLTERIENALKDVKYDEQRLLSEVAFYADRVNIDEELTRLNSHINQFREIVKTQSAGKKLDFLMQEFNRETNTICSKSNDIEITKYALGLKNEIEKIREQVQNLE